MTSFENKAVGVIDNFRVENFNFWKFKFKILLVSINLCDIVDKSKKSSPFNAGPKVLKEFNYLSKKLCPSSTLTWRTTNLRTLRIAQPFANLHKRFSLSNIIIMCCKVFLCKIQRAMSCLTTSTRLRRSGLN